MLGNQSKIKLIKPPSKVNHSQSEPNEFKSSEPTQIKRYKTKDISIPPQTERFMIKAKQKRKQIKSRNKQNIRQRQANLKHIITQVKKKAILKNFKNILKRNNTNSKPTQYNPFHTYLDVSFIDSKGYELNEYVFIILAFFSVIQIVTLSIMYTLAIVFEDIEKSQILTICQTISMVFYIVEILINFATVKLQEGKRLLTFRQIWIYYLKQNFPIDFFSIVILIIDMNGRIPATIYLRLFIILKLHQGLEKVQKLEILFINNYYYQQYWSLVKVFLFNFSFAHILAICLLAMAAIDDSQNWMIVKGIADNPWYEKYVWSYYWSTTIMLTVGFGDIAASTYKEALLITFIQTISCIVLAYNINSVGTLISNIRSKDLQKRKNFKIFRKLSQKNHVSGDLQWRINNYIEQSSQIKKKFNYQEQNVFVQKLPNGLKTQFLKESNKKIFQNLPFFRNLMQKTLFNFAQRIEMHICHPSQIIQHIDDPHNLLILKEGEIGFACKKAGCDFNKTIINTYRCNSIEEPYLVSMGFITKNPHLFEIHSLQYSILYFLDHQKIRLILKESQKDYEIYCHLRDKASFIQDEFESFPCQQCKSRHTKFNCPKLHYIPIQTHILSKQIYNIKHSKCIRTKDMIRLQNPKLSATKNYTIINEKTSKERYLLGNNKVQKTNMSIDKEKQFIQTLKYSTIQTKEIASMHKAFYKSTVNIIKNEVNRVLNSQNYDQFWLIQSDKMKNFKWYFETDNSYNLANKLSNLNIKEAINTQQGEIQTNQRQLNGYDQITIN